MHNLRDNDNNIHKVQTLAKIERLINKYMNTDASKASKFMYWLEDYTKFLEFEDKFRPSSLRRYKRGEIIKAHLGYNIGSEEGGLHYCVVIEKDNSLYSPLLTVIPLTSYKKDSSKKLHKDQVFLGQDLKEKVNKKYSNVISEANYLLDELNQKKLAILHNPDVTAEFMPKFEKLQEKIEIANKLEKELEKMKDGSIALIGQITTISKIRIYDPKTNKDPLSDIKLSNENLDKIDNAIKERFCK